MRKCVFSLLTLIIRSNSRMVLVQCTFVYTKTFYVNSQFYSSRLTIDVKSLTTLSKRNVQLLLLIVNSYRFT